MTVDHKLARALGGTNARRNIQALCKPCNWQKAAEEVHLLTLLRTVAGRAELWRQWPQLRAEQTARSQRKRARQEAQYGEALRRMEANRQAGRCESPPPPVSEAGAQVGP